jgi:hypothetical protein
LIRRYFLGIFRFAVTAQVPLQIGAEQSFYPMIDSGLFTTRFTFVRGAAVVRDGSEPLRSSKRGVPGQLQQNEIPLKNSAESRDYAHPKVRGAKLVAPSTFHGCACPGHLIIGALCLPDRRDKPDEPGDDVAAAATSFAALTQIALKYFGE